METLENKDLTRAEIKRIENYSVGDYVKAHRAYRSLNLKSKKLCKIAEVNSSHIVLEKSNGDRIKWEPVRQNRFSVYRPESLEITADDRVRITENDHPNPFISITGIAPPCIQPKVVPANVS